MVCPVNNAAKSNGSAAFFAPLVATLALERATTIDDDLVHFRPIRPAAAPPTTRTRPARSSNERTSRHRSFVMSSRTSSACVPTSTSSHPSGARNFAAPATIRRVTSMPSVPDTKCTARLPLAHLGLETRELGAPAIRRVRDDGVEALVFANGPVEIALAKFDAVGHAVPRGVPRRHLQCGGGDVSRNHAQRGNLHASAIASAPEPVTEIEKRRPRARAEHVERGFDENLGLGARNQHAPVDLEVERPEFAAAENVGDGLAHRAAPQEVAENRSTSSFSSGRS
jgi:hypothetical protein